MNKITIAKIIAGLSVAVGFIVMTGWYLDVTVLTSILPQWIRMKFATATCFVFSGVVIYALTFKRDERIVTREILLTIFPTLIALIMGILFTGSILGFQTGLENISFIDIHEINTPIFQGRPSVSTMTMFLLIATLGFLYNFSKPTKRSFFVIGSIVGIGGFLGILGYVFGVPALYYEIPGYSNAIAINTTILFTLLGAAIFMIGQEKETTYEDAQ